VHVPSCARFRPMSRTCLSEIRGALFASVGALIWLERAGPSAKPSSQDSLTYEGLRTTWTMAAFFDR
jgi:hypothetical protein